MSCHTLLKWTLNLIKANCRCLISSKAAHSTYLEIEEYALLVHCIMDLETTGALQFRVYKRGSSLSFLRTVDQKKGISKDQPLS